MNKTDFEATYINCIKGDNPKAGVNPLYTDTDRKVLNVALNTIGYVQPENAKVIRIRNTLNIKEIMVSEAYHAETRSRDDLSIIKPVREMVFGADGRLLPF